MKNHKPEWDVYREMRTRSNAKVTQAKVDKKEACEMENSEVRFYDVRSSKAKLLWPWPRGEYDCCCPFL